MLSIIIVEYSDQRSQVLPLIISTFVTITDFLFVLIFINEILTKCFGYIHTDGVDYFLTSSSDSFVLYFKNLLNYVGILFTTYIQMLGCVLCSFDLRCSVFQRSVNLYFVIKLCNLYSPLFGRTQFSTLWSYMVWAEGLSAVSFCFLFIIGVSAQQPSIFQDFCVTMRILFFGVLLYIQSVAIFHGEYSVNSVLTGIAA